MSQLVHGTSQETSIGNMLHSDGKEFPEMGNRAGTEVARTLSAIGNLEFWFEALDGYTGPDPARWLAAQWTWNGEDSPTVESRLPDASVVISEWRLRNVDVALIECAKPVTSIGRAAA